jgi:hypothetical protein
LIDANILIYAMALTVAGVEFIDENGGGPGAATEEGLGVRARIAL